MTLDSGVSDAKVPVLSPPPYIYAGLNRCDEHLSRHVGTGACVSQLSWSSSSFGTEIPHSGKLLSPRRTGMAGHPPWGPFLHGTEAW